MTSDRERLEAALSTWAQEQAALIVQRNQLVGEALAAGITKQEIHQWTGVARTTIDRIIVSGEVARVLGRFATEGES